MFGIENMNVDSAAAAQTASSHGSGPELAPQIQQVITDMNNRFEQKLVNMKAYYDNEMIMAKSYYDKEISKACEAKGKSFESGFKQALKKGHGQCLPAKFSSLATSGPLKPWAKVTQSYLCLPLR